MAERDLDAGTNAALQAAEEIFIGANHLGPLALGHYGTPLDADAASEPRSQLAPVVRVVVDAIVGALATGAQATVAPTPRSPPPRPLSLHRRRRRSS